MVWPTLIPISPPLKLRPYGAQCSPVAREHWQVPQRVQNTDLDVVTSRKM